MRRALLDALGELGLSATEAEVYVALVQRAEDGPVTAYALARDLGRDPANLTKTLAVMVRRGAVRSSGQRPRRYAPVAPEDFTGALVARLLARQQQALELLREVGRAPRDEDRRVLSSRREALAEAGRLLADAGKVVLIDGAVELLRDLAEALAAAAARGVSVMVRSSEPVAIPGAQIRHDQDDAAPGPWLRLAVDATACLELLADPQDDERLLYGHRSRDAAQAYLTHRSLLEAPAADPGTDDALQFVYRRRRSEG